jgi:hypothetical protein
LPILIRSIFRNKKEENKGTRTRTRTITITKQVHNQNKNISLVFRVIEEHSFYRAKLKALPIALFMDTILQYIMSTKRENKGKAGKHLSND